MKNSCMLEEVMAYFPLNRVRQVNSIHNTLMYASHKGIGSIMEVHR
jgi:hypothetical protein